MINNKCDIEEDKLNENMKYLILMTEEIFCR